MKLWLPALFAAVLAGCSPPQPTVGGELPNKIYARVISLSPSTTEWVSMLLAENVLVGRTAVDTQPVSIRGVTIVANPRPDFEKIVKMQPDLIIVDENVINPADLAKLRQLAGPNKFEVVAFRVNSLKDWEESVWKLGALLNQFAEASKRVDAVREAAERFKTPVSARRPKVLVATGSSNPWAAGTESFQADVVRAAGGDPVGPAGQKFSPVNPEQILAWDPDIVFVDEPAAKYVAPEWKSIKAGKTNNIYEVNPDLLLRPGMRVDDLINGLGRVITNSVPGK